MLVLQLTSGGVLFLRELLSRELPPEAVFAVFLAFLVLAGAGLAFSSPKIRLPLIVMKGILGVALRPFALSPLLLLPTIGLELPGLFFAKFPAWLWAIYAGAWGAAALAFPLNLIPFYIGLWILSVFTAAGELTRKASEARSASRIRALEKELATAEAKRASMEKAAAGQELLIKFQERDSIAQKLHDELGHTITGSIMQLEAAGLILPDDPGRVAAILSKVSRTLKDGLAAIRSSLQAIKPEPALLGLGKIQSLLDAFESDYGRSVDLATEGNVNAIPARLWQVIETNLQEALTNMLKHSSGHNFACRISVLNRMIKAEFRDDGVVGAAVKPGMGLEGMETRTREAGGTLIIDARQGFSAIMLFGKGD